MKIKRFAAVLMALCLMTGSALAARFTVDRYGVMTAIEPDPDSETLVIPAQAWSEERGEAVPVTKITADFSGFSGLKYILFEDFGDNPFPQVDLGMAPDLECVYFIQNVTNEMIGKVTTDGDLLLQWLNLNNKEISNITAEYADGRVTIQFPNIIPEGYDGYGYRVTREAIGNSGSKEVFDFERDVSRFGISNGTVTFTDFIDQTALQQKYRYTITAYEPFGISVMPQASVDVTIPAEPAPEEPAPVPVPAAPDAVPATGDEAAPLLWTALIAMSAIGMAMALRKRKQA